MARSWFLICARLAVAAFAGLWAGLAPANAQTVPEAGIYSRDEALFLGRQALQSGDAMLAHQIARRILTQNPEDSAALLLIAASGPDIGQARLARLSGGAAWRASRGEAKGFRYEIARFTARAALAEGRLAYSEVWLRRAMDTAPDAAARERNRLDLATLRARRPLSFRLNAGLAPSSNLNAGSGGADLMIDGIHYVGPISSTGQQLAGWRADLSGELLWRLHASATAQTELGFSLAANHHWLSAASQAKVDNDPMLAGRGRFTGTDLDEVALEARLRQSFAVAGVKAPVQVELAVGQTWYGTEKGGTSLALSGVLPLASSETGRLGLVVQARKQWHDRGAPSEAFGLRLVGDRRLGPGQLRFGLSLGEQSRDGDINATFQQAGADIGYSLDRLGPLRLDAQVTLATRDQDDFRLGPVAVTDGRHDQRLGLAISVGFPEMTVMGLEPVLKVSGQRGWSNISRYENNEAAMGFGFSARF